ncbi:hypothetical protein Salat_2432200 [Sesamum alatum]|uniref:RNase H type-1 domain-containing protein n=1 Tax=Sesamum alatum TaxID=300844 RepID=A0AAE1XZ93_9LAMI|nr:hypothetical protein Salat_2432200 [Sesamum alatum]
MEPSPPGTVKLNFDTAIFKSKEGAGAGVIAPDEFGCVSAWHAEQGEGEAAAARTAVELCNHYGWEQCTLEGDGLQIVWKLQAQGEDLSVARTPVGPGVGAVLR